MHEIFFAADCYQSLLIACTDGDVKNKKTETDKSKTKTTSNSNTKIRNDIKLESNGINVLLTANISWLINCTTISWYRLKYGIKTEPRRSTATIN